MQVGNIEPAPAEEAGPKADEGSASFGYFYACVDVGIFSLTDGAEGWVDGPSVVEGGGLDTAVRAGNFSHLGSGGVRIEWASGRYRVEVLHIGLGY